MFNSPNLFDKRFERRSRTAEQGPRTGCRTGSTSDQAGRSRLQTIRNYFVNGDAPEPTYDKTPDLDLSSANADARQMKLPQALIDEPFRIIRVPSRRIVRDVHEDARDIGPLVAHATRRSDRPRLSVDFPRLGRRAHKFRERDGRDGARARGRRQSRGRLRLSNISPRRYAAQYRAHQVI